MKNFLFLFGALLINFCFAENLFAGCPPGVNCGGSIGSYQCTNGSCQYVASSQQYYQAPQQYYYYVAAPRQIKAAPAVPERKPFACPVQVQIKTVYRDLPCNKRHVVELKLDNFRNW